MDDQGSSWTSPTKRLPWSTPPRQRVSELRKRFERSPKKKAHPQEERYNQDQFQNQEKIQYQEDSYNQEENDWQRNADYDQNDYDRNERYSNQDAHHESYRDEPSSSYVPESEPTGYNEGSSHTGRNESPLDEPRNCIPSPPERKHYSARPRNERHDPYPRPTGAIYDSDEEDPYDVAMEKRRPEDTKQFVRYLFTKDLSKEDISTFPEWIQDIIRRGQNPPEDNLESQDNPVPGSSPGRASQNYETANVAKVPSEDNLESQDKPVPGSSPGRVSQNNETANLTEVPPEDDLESQDKPVQRRIPRWVERPETDDWRSTREKMTRKKSKVEEGLMHPGFRFVIRFAHPYAVTGIPWYEDVE